MFNFKDFALAVFGVAVLWGLGSIAGGLESMQRSLDLSPMAGGLIEVEEKTALNASTPTEVCTADGRQVSSYACTVENDDSDVIIYRGGNAVASTDGMEFCDACRAGKVIAGDSRSSYLIAASGTPDVRCICGYR